MFSVALAVLLQTCEQPVTDHESFDLIGESDIWRGGADVEWIADDIVSIDRNGIRVFRNNGQGHYNEDIIGISDTWRGGTAIAISEHHRIASIDRKGVRIFIEENDIFEETIVAESNIGRGGADIAWDGNNIISIDRIGIRIFSHTTAGEYHIQQIAETDIWEGGAAIVVSDEGTIASIDRMGIRIFTVNDNSYVESTIAEAEIWRGGVDIEFHSDDIVAIDSKGIRYFHHLGNHKYEETRISNSYPWKGGVAIEVSNEGEIYTMDRLGIRQFTPSNTIYLEEIIVATDIWSGGASLGLKEKLLVSIDRNGVRLY